MNKSQKNLTFIVIVLLVITVAVSVYFSMKNKSPGKSIPAKQVNSNNVSTEPQEDIQAFLKLYPNVSWIQATTTTLGKNALYYGKFSDNYVENSFDLGGRQWNAEFTYNDKNAPNYPLSYDDFVVKLQERGWNCGFDGVNGLVSLDGYKLNPIAADGALGGISGCMKVVDSKPYEIVISSEKTHFTSNADPDGPIAPVCPCTNHFSIFLSDPIVTENLNNKK